MKLASASYDQWKTASPYDDVADLAADYDVACPVCGGEFFEDLETADWPVVTLECSDCGHIWDQNLEAPAMSAEQEKRLEDLQRRFDKAQRDYRPQPGLTLDEFFRDLDVDGDFHWDDAEDGDWHVYCCHEKACPKQWHMFATAVEIGRQNGQRWVLLREVDEDGNWDTRLGYDERDGDPIEAWDEVAAAMATDSAEFFRGWAAYWLDAAQTGKDPCKQMGKSDKNFVARCLDRAEDNIRSFMK